MFINFLVSSVLFIALTTLVVIGTGGMYFAKSEILQKISTIIMFILSICMGFISFSSLSNIIVSVPKDMTPEETSKVVISSISAFKLLTLKINSFLISGISVVGVALNFYKKINGSITKIFILTSNIIGLIYIVFCNYAIK